MRRFVPILLAAGCMAQLGQAQSAAGAQVKKVDPVEGMWQGYDPEWGHVTRQMVALAEAIPEEKYSWRPGAGVRSTSEVIMHLAVANFYLLDSAGGPKMAKTITGRTEREVTKKADVLDWLKRSFEAVRVAHLNVKPQELARRVNVEGYDATADGVYLRLLIHANEHMGQLIAYARMNGIAPPW